MIQLGAHSWGRRWEGRAVVIALALLLGILLAPISQAAHSARKKHHHARVLRVGKWKGIKGQFRTIQAAVDAAKPGDWILVGPGDYHERADHRKNRGPQPDHTPAALVIGKKNIHLRGMNRSKVVVDGTKPGSPRCSNKAKYQDFGVKGSDGKPLGRNGILAWKADGVSIDNLTACNFLNGAGSVGNEIWWNGGDGGGKIGIHNIEGQYLTSTSTFYKTAETAASYAIFSSNASGGTWNHMYASNMSDSNYYVGACQQVCDQTLNDVHSQYSVQGFSGTNAGGTLIVKNSEFDHNKTGFTAGALNNDDWPSPQNGMCLKGNSPITHSYSCYVLMHNSFHDNNNPNVPGQGIATAAPTGTGILLYGGRNNTMQDNTFTNNGAWGVAFVTYPDSETPPDDAVAAGANCRGGVNVGPPVNACVYDDWGNRVIHNTFRHNGWFKNFGAPGGSNSSNADIGEITSIPGPTNCYHGNIEAGGGQVTTSPSGLQQSKAVCDHHTVPPNGNSTMTNDILCDSQAEGTPCSPGSFYPQATGVKMPPVPKNLKTMPNPCKGVPANPWCGKKK